MTCIVLVRAFSTRRSSGFFFVHNTPPTCPMVFGFRLSALRLNLLHKIHSTNLVSNLYRSTRETIFLTYSELDISITCRV